MESLIGMVNRIQRACTALGDYGGGNNALSSLWEALPSVAVVGGQVHVSSDVFNSTYVFSLASLTLFYVMNVEFWKVFCPREHCRKRFSP